MSIQANLPSELPAEGTSAEFTQDSTPGSALQSPVESPQLMNCQVPQSSQALTNSVQVRLSTGGVQFDFASQQSVSNELVELTAKLETAAEIIKDLSTRLDGALYLVGHMEAQLTAKDEEIRKLNEANKRWWKRLSVWKKGT